MGGIWPEKGYIWAFFGRKTLDLKKNPPANPPGRIYGRLQISIPYYNKSGVLNIIYLFIYPFQIKKNKLSMM